MNNITVIELNKKSSEGLVLKIEDIKHIKFNLELSFSRLIEKINNSIEKCNFQEGREYYFIAKKLYSNNSKINSLGFILEERALKEKYENIKNSYDLLDIKKELVNLINSIRYLGEIEESEEYKNSYKEALSIRNRINEEEILNDLAKKVKNINSVNNEEASLLIKEVFQNKYEDNFYNSMEFVYNIIENNIYINIEDFYSLQENLEEINLLYKFNLEKDINEKINVLYKLNISEFINIEYAYKPYAIKSLKEKKYKTLDNLKKDLLNINKDIKTFDKKSMPI